MRLPVDRGLPLLALIALAGCGGGSGRTALAPALPSSGPGADFPVVLGAAFTVDGVTYTPADKLNYDEVGLAVAGADGGEGVSLAHRTLPLPSYVEVTALDTGRTILVRAERRGPMSGRALVELSPGAASQLGLTSLAPVRVRRVNPPEIERAALRRGERAPERMATPKSLLGVLMRKFDPAAARPEPAQPPQTVAAAANAKDAPDMIAATAKEPATGRVVQVGAFSVKANAEATAARVGGTIAKSGSLWLVRLGPFDGREQVAQALAKARGAGYSDARIQRVD